MQDYSHRLNLMAETIIKGEHQGFAWEKPQVSENTFGWKCAALPISYSTPEESELVRMILARLGWGMDKKHMPALVPTPKLEDFPAHPKPRADSLVFLGEAKPKKMSELDAVYSSPDKRIMFHRRSAAGPVILVERSHLEKIRANMRSFGPGRGQAGATKSGE